MSFKRKDMHIFSQRCKAIMASMQNIREEAAAMTAIYVNEAGSGTDPEFVDTGGISKQEHIGAVAMFEELKIFGDALEPTMTPFLQGRNP